MAARISFRRGRVDQSSCFVWLCVCWVGVDGCSHYAAWHGTVSFKYVEEKKKRGEIPAGSTGLESIISAAWSVWRMLLVLGLGAAAAAAAARRAVWDMVAAAPARGDVE